MLNDDASTRSNATIKRKVGKILDVTVNDPFRDVMTYTHESILLRKQTTTQHPSSQLLPVVKWGMHSGNFLRMSLEDNVLNLHEQYLSEMRHVYEAYDEVASAVEELDTAATEICKDVQDTCNGASDLVCKVALLQEELREVRAREEQVRRFFCRYNLSVEESEVIGSGPIDERFIVVMNKIKEIHASCRELLSAHQNQQSAVEIMETMFLAQMNGAERLSKHLLAIIPSAFSHDLPDLSDHVISCFQVLQERPAQWLRVLHEVTRIRRTVVIRQFFDLLNKGISSGSVTAGSSRSSAVLQRPLDSLSNDPTRMFGELFAWLHQAIAEEDDILSCVMGDPKTVSGSSSVVVVDAAVQSMNAKKQELLDLIVEPLNKHIKVRFDAVVERCKKQAAQSPYPVLLSLFRMDTIFAFYVETISSALGSNGSLSVLTNRLKIDILRFFFDLLKGVCSSTIVNGKRSNDLSPSPEFEEVVRLLKSMCDSMLQSTVAHSSREMEILPILSAVVDPIPGMVQQLTGIDDPLAKCVLRINCYIKLHAALTGFSFTASKLLRLRELLRSDVHLYLNEASSRSVNKFSFENRAKRVASLFAGEVVGGVDKKRQEEEMLLVEEVCDSLSQFYVVVYQVGNLNIPFAEQIQASRLKVFVSKTVAFRVCSAYAHLYDLIHSDGDGGVLSAVTLSKMRATAINSPKSVAVLLDAEDSPMEINF